MAPEHPDDQIQPLVESLHLSGALDEAMKARDQGLREDSEWTQKDWVHRHTLVECFAKGVISADPWHKNYRLPPNFEAVVNWISFCIQKHWEEHGEVVQTSLIEVSDLFHKWASENKDFLKWNEPEDPNTPAVVASCRYTPTPEVRDFIDLDALLGNAVLALRDKWRLDREFDRQFEEKYGPITGDDVKG